MHNGWVENWLEISNLPFFILNSLDFDTYEFEIDFLLTVILKSTTGDQVISFKTCWN